MWMKNIARYIVSESQYNDSTFCNQSVKWSFTPRRVMIAAHEGRINPTLKLETLFFYASRGNNVYVTRWSASDSGAPVEGGGA